MAGSAGPTAVARARLAQLLLFGILLTITPGAEEPPPVTFDVQVKLIFVGGGPGRTYDLTPDELVVSRPTPDRDDDPEATEEVLRVALDEEQSREVQRFLAKFPLKRLRKRYTNPLAHDGMQLDFEISIAGSAVKRISLFNKSQPDLRRLCGRINGLIEDEELRVDFPNTKRPPLPEDG